MTVKLEIKVIDIMDLDETIKKLDEIIKNHPDYELDVQIKVGM